MKPNKEEQFFCLEVKGLMKGLTRRSLAIGIAFNLALSPSLWAANTPSQNDGNKITAIRTQQVVSTSKSKPKTAANPKPASKPNPAPSMSLEKAIDAIIRIEEKAGHSVNKQDVNVYSIYTSLGSKGQKSPFPLCKRYSCGPIPPSTSLFYSINRPDGRLYRNASNIEHVINPRPKRPGTPDTVMSWKIVEFKPVHASKEDAFHVELLEVLKILPKFRREYPNLKYEDIDFGGTAQQGEVSPTGEITYIIYFSIGEKAYTAKGKYFLSSIDQEPRYMLL